MWGLVTSYVFFGKAEEGAQIDRFRKKKSEIKAPDIQALSASNEPQGHNQPQKDDDEQENDDDERGNDADERRD